MHGPRTTPPAPPATSVARSRGAGAAITDEAWSRYEPGQKTTRRIVFPAIGCDGIDDSRSHAGQGYGLVSNIKCNG